MPEIALTQGKVAVVDHADIALVSLFRWYALADRRDGRVRWYAHTKVFQSTVMMHRLVTGAPRGVVVDHRDGDGLNNTRSNLRRCTTAQNNRNRGAAAANSSGYKGVFRRSSTGRWQAQISVDNRSVYLGLFSTAEEAAAAYNDAARRFHGEFALLNEVRRGR